MPTFVFPIKITVIWEASEVLLTHLFKSSSLNAVAKRKGNGLDALIKLHIWLSTDYEGINHKFK